MQNMIISPADPPPAGVITSPANIPAVNPVALLLADKRSPATKRAYKADLSHFFGGEPPPAVVHEFLGQPPPAVALRLASYKGEMLAQKLAEATINRRLAAVRSLLKMSYRLGLSQTDGRGLVDGEKTTAYRDTRGVDLETMRRLVALPHEAHGTGTLRARRDVALLRLLCENTLRRAEVCALTVADFELGSGKRGARLHILGKGKGTQKAPVTLSEKCALAVADYLLAAGHGAEGAGPLFRNLDHRPDQAGAGLTVNGLYWLMGDYGKRLGVRLSPHKLRHSGITAALDATGGDVRRVQRLSRHADLRTLQRYDDNRSDMQGEVTGLLSGLL